MSATFTPARRAAPVAAAVTIGLLASGGLIWYGTHSAFTATTSNTGNTWAAGAVALTDSQNGTAAFSASNLAPGATGVKCITVTYTGTASGGVAVKLYTANKTGTLGDYLNLTVDEGTGGSADCTGFTSGTSDYTGTLTAFAAKNSYANGVSTWAPTVTGAKTYKFTYTLDPATPDTAQSATAGMDFIWEAHTS